MLAVWFWILMLLVVIFGGLSWRSTGDRGLYLCGGGLILFLLLLCLGIKVFGSPFQ